MNDNKEIYDILKPIQSNKEIFDSLTDEEQQIVRVSLLDIQLSTQIHKTPTERDEIKQVRSDILLKEDEFYRLCHDTSNDQNFEVAMKTNESQTERKEIYQTFYQNDHIRFDSLQNLRVLRHSYAQQIGYDSFTALKAETSLFEGNVDAIHKYLTKWSKLIEPQCNEEIKGLLPYNNNFPIRVWDLTFAQRAKHLQQMEQSRAAQSGLMKDIERYLDIGHCMQSLVRLMNICFDIEMEKELFADDENIFKYSLKRAFDDEIIGILYFDLYQRQNKASSETVTFPIFCAYEGQKAQVVVSMNLQHNDGKNVSYHQLIALYHEFGHALSYLLSSTQYQTLSGSRGLSVEYLEFPSTFFQNFLFDPLFVKYVLLDNQMITAPDENILNSIKNPFYSSLHFMQQINDSLLDLSLFGDESKQRQSIQDIAYSAYKPMAVMMGNESASDIEEAVHGYCLRASRFHHFVDYGACYFSYFIAERMSEGIWTQTFGQYERLTEMKDDRVAFENWKKHCRHHGQRLIDKVLAFGATRSPIKCLNDFAGSTADLF